MQTDLRTEEAVRQFSAGVGRRVSLTGLEVSINTRFGICTERIGEPRMALNIDGTPFYWPDGRPGTIRQQDFRRDVGGTHHAFLVYLEAERPGEPSPRGALWLTAATLDDVPGIDESEKSRAVGQALAEWIQNRGLSDGFSLLATVVNGRVEIHAAGN